MKQISFVVLVAILLVMIASFTPMVGHASGFSDDVIGITIGEGGEMTVSGSAFEEDRTGAWASLIERYKGFIAGIAGIATVTMIVLFIMQFMKLAASAGNPQARSQALVGVLWTGIATAGLGAVTIIVGFFYRAI